MPDLGNFLKFARLIHMFLGYSMYSVSFATIYTA